MANDISNLHQEPYTTDYLDSIKARFPELAHKTRLELIETLEANKDRTPGEYEFIWKDALNQIEGEALLDYPDDSLFTYLFEELPHEQSEKTRELLTFAMKNGGSGDVIVGSRTEPRKADFDLKIGADVNADDYMFISEGGKNYLKRGKEKQFLVVLRVLKKHEQDSYGRQHFDIKTELIEIPDQGARILSWMLFKKDLNVAEFKESFAKCVA